MEHEIKILTKMEKKEICLALSPPFGVPWSRNTTWQHAATGIEEPCSASHIACLQTGLNEAKCNHCIICLVFKPSSEQQICSGQSSQDCWVCFKPRSVTQHFHEPRRLVNWSTLIFPFHNWPTESHLKQQGF